MKKSFREISFKSGKNLLKGFIHETDNAKASYVIGSHGLLSDGNSLKQIELAKRLAKKNIGYLRFHHMGCNDSQGNLKDSDLNTRRRDLISALEFLKQNYITDKIGLFGSSMVGATCIYSYDDINPDAAVLAASPVIGESMKKSFSGSIDILMKETGLPENFFLKNIDFDLVNNLGNIKNTLVIHGNKDNIVPVENGEKLFAGIGNEKKFLKLENGNHRIEDLKHQKIFIDEAVCWFAKYL